jgi:hypothetical protein
MPEGQRTGRGEFDQGGLGQVGLMDRVLTTLGGWRGCGEFYCNRPAAIVGVAFPVN